MSKDTVSEGNRLRCSWTVTAGVIPGVPMPEHTRRWLLTSEQFYKENDMSPEEFKTTFPDGQSTFLKYKSEAQLYADSLQDPRYINWVNVNWLWL
jgi:hypothetical protein